MDISLIKNLERWASELNGVFTLPDLKVALREESQATLFRKVKSLTDSRVIVKVKRGVYASPGTGLDIISSRIDKEAYISTGTILAKHAAIGSVPAYKVQAIKLGRSRTYSCELGTIEHLSLASKYYFGFTEENGILKALPEKAFIDVCYFSYKGSRFSFNPESDINIEIFKRDLLEEFLRKYDQRFITFFRSKWKLS